MYNMSKIMKRAWEFVKKAGMTISKGLKKAWEEAKKAVKKIRFSGYARVAKIENGQKNPYIGTEYDSESNYLSFCLWEKGGRRRIYMNDYNHRAVAYIDLNTNEVVTGYAKGVAVETAEYFLANYQF